MSTKATTVKLHVLFFGLLLVAFNSFWTMMGTEVWHSTQLTIASLFFNAVFTLFVLVLLNLFLQRISPRISFSQADLQTIYVMIVMLTTISGHTMMGYLMPVLAHAFMFASVENEWVRLFSDYIPPWLAIKDRQILLGLYQGDATLYRQDLLQTWTAPVLAWSSFVIALWLVLLATTVLLRKQWTENEKLDYPIVQLPLALTQDSVGFLKNRWMWFGFAVAGMAELINGLNYLYPEVPSLPIKGATLARFTTRPWNAIGTIHAAFYPFTIGLMFFTPLDLSFSCWFFWWFARLQQVAIVALGGRNIYHLEQQTGAWIAFGFIALWMGRRYYLRILQGLFARQPILDDTREPMSYRLATGIFSVGMVFLILFCQQMGMSLWVAGLFFLFYFPMVIGITRIRAEIGPPLHQLIFVDPGRTLTILFGTRRLGVANLTGLTFLYPFVRCFRAHPMPSELEAFRLAERANIAYRQLLVGMILAIVFGILITFWIYLHMLYEMGAASKARGWLIYMGWETFNRLQSWIIHPTEPKPVEASMIGASFLFTIFLMVMKVRFLWWPLHPGGYVLISGTGMGGLWFPIFLSWAIKSIILKVGGIRQYRRAVPFFLGLILGDYTLGCFWSLLGLVWQKPTYIVWH